METMTRAQQAKIDRIIGEKHYRSTAVEKSAVNEELRTVEVAFSSEDPYARWFGIEILGHDRSEVDMGFLSSGRAPLLDQHDHGKQLGVIEKAWIDSDRVGRAMVRFGKSAGADEFFRDVVDGIRTNISVGYQVNEMKLIETDEADDTYRVTKWSPFEVSFVSVPADKTVGVGRSADKEFVTIQLQGETMKKEEENGQSIDLEALKAQAKTEARQAEVNRVRDITTMGQVHGMEADAKRFVEDGKEADTFRRFVLDELAKRGIRPVETPDTNIGLSEKEIRKFSFVRAIHALANPNKPDAQRAAAFEYECSEAVGKKLKKDSDGIYIPTEVQTRDLVVGTTTAGGHTVATNLLAGSFIDLLRNRMMVQKMGATILTGLVGDLAIPRQTGGATCYWVAESGAPTESQQAFDQVTMSPNTVGAFTDISRKLLLQSSIDVENFVRVDLAKVLGLGIDLAGINGSGSSNQPEGILNVTGIGAVAGGTNGAAPTWGNLISLWSEVAQDNADVGSLGYLTNSTVIGKLMQTDKASGTAQFVVRDFPDMDGMTAMGGARCGVSNQVPSNLTKGTSSGVCSAIIYGNWSDLLIGMWGGMSLTVDPYSNSTQGTVRVVVLQDVDVAVRHPQSFAAMVDALTT